MQLEIRSTYEEPIEVVTLLIKLSKELRIPVRVLKYQLKNQGYHEATLYYQIYI